MKGRNQNIRKKREEKPSKIEENCGVNESAGFTDETIRKEEHKRTARVFFQSPRTTAWHTTRGDVRHRNTSDTISSLRWLYFKLSMSSGQVKEEWQAG